jgi:hypothetical protein
MADPLTKDELVRVSATWAKDATLDEISGRIGNTNELLLRIGKAFGKRFDATALNEEFKKTGQTIKQVGDGANQTAKGFTNANKGLRDFDNSVADLRYNLGKYKQSIGDLVTGSRDATQMLPGIAKDVGTTLALFSQRIPAVAKLIVGFGTAIGFGVQRYLDSAEVYRDMMQSGALFSGSIEGFARTVRSNGVSLAAAQQVINKQTQAILITGETRFFATVGRMGTTFDKFGLKMDQGTELLGELFEIQRLTGSLYGKSQDELVDTNNKLVTLLNAQVRLTGISVRRQTEEARRIAEDDRVRIIAQSLPRQMQEAITTFSASLSASNIPTDVASELVRELVTGAPGRASGRLRLFAPAETEELFAAARTGDQTRITEALKQIQRAAAEISSEQRAGIAYSTDAELRRLIVALTDMYRITSRPTTDIPGKSPEDIFKDTLNGLAVTSKTTQDLFGAQGTFTRAFGTFESRLIDVAKDTGAIGLFTESLNKAAKGIEMVSTASNAVMLALAGGLAALGVSKIGKQIAKGIGPSSPGRPPGGGLMPGATPAAGPGGLARGIDRTIKGGGVALGVNAVAEGARYFDANDLVQTTLDFAGYGAMAGSLLGPKGAAIGALAGGVVGGGVGAYNYATTPSAATQELRLTRERIQALADVGAGEVVGEQRMSHQLAELVELERNAQAMELRRDLAYPALAAALNEQTRIIETALRNLTRATENNQ